MSDNEQIDDQSEKNEATQPQDMDRLIEAINANTRAIKETNSTSFWLVFIALAQIQQCSESCIREQQLMKQGHTEVSYGQYDLLTQEFRINTTAQDSSNDYPVYTFVERPTNLEL